MKTIKFLALLFFFSLVMFSCSKEQDTVTMRLEIFECCNPWDDLQIRPTEQVIIGVFFRNEGLDSKSIDIEKLGDGVICGQCCECPTGNFVLIEIERSEIKTARKLGFQWK